MTQPSGMLLFDKPEGWTSHDAVAAFRRMLPKGVKVGHCGTLDPLATGLLILLVGPCTRLQAHMQGLDKVYAGKIRLGLRTDTGDVAGRVLAKAREFNFAGRRLFAVWNLLGTALVRMGPDPWALYRSDLGLLDLFRIPGLGHNVSHAGRAG